MSKSQSKSQQQNSNISNQEQRREQPSNTGSRAFFALLSLAYIAVEGYHLAYNMQVLNQRKSDPYYNQDKLPMYGAYLILSLLPALIIAIFGLTLCLFKDQDKVLRKAGIFRFMSYLYLGLILYGVYKIWYDWFYEHHHNHRMMSYMFYLDFMVQWGPAFIYTTIFRQYAQSSSVAHKPKNE
eukprot:403341721